jgi:hypothetical protein
VLLNVLHLHDCDAWPALMYLVVDRTILTWECKAVA